MSATFTELTYFIELATERNFTRAAKSLYISQPLLSQHIKKLEAAVGVELFRRRPSGVELTPAGEVMLTRAIELVRIWTGAREEAQHAAADQRRHVVVGFTVYPRPGLLAAIARELADVAPLLRVHPRRAPFDEELAGLDSGEAQLAILWRDEPVPKSCRSITLFEDDWALLFRWSSPLSSQSAVSAEDLVSQPLLVWPKTALPTPRGCRNTTAVSDELFELVSITDAVAILPRTIADWLRRADQEVRPVVGLPPLSVHLVWHADDALPSTKAIVTAARRVLDAMPK